VKPTGGNSSAASAALEGRALGLTSWVGAPDAGHGLRYWDSDGGWALHTWDEIADRARAIAALIGERRTSDDGPVCIVVEAGPDFVATFFGALLAGHPACPLPPALMLQTPIAYTEHLASLIGTARPAIVLTDERHTELVAEAVQAAGLPHTPVPLSEVRDGGAPDAAPAPDVALLQFTSGSSGTPRGARIPPATLEANIRMMIDWLDIEHGKDTIAGWLPPFHDMGLIGCLLVPAYLQLDVLLMRPDQFIRRPVDWLRCHGEFGATLGVSPSFGFSYARKRIDPADLAGLDFSTWRAAVCGAERVDVTALNGFADFLVPHGYDPRTFVPAYGMAEATLAITGARTGELVRAARVDWPALDFGHPVQLLEEAPLDGRPELSADGGGTWLASCGYPMRGLDVQIVGDDGQPVPDGVLGEVLIEGPSVGDGYHGGDDTGSSEFVGPQRLRTGDAAFFADGELFVIGRIGDSVKLRGRSLYVEDLELRLPRDVSRGRSVVFSGQENGRDLVVALVERDPGPWAAEACEALLNAVGGYVEVKVLTAPRGTIQRTSSGKPRRRLMWRAFMEGRLGAQTLAESVEGKVVERDPVALATTPA
jgi:fatty-acyl-CoA synthase